ncbi:MAG: ATP-binding cassette domain-containing protein [Thermoleophilaceae bacterium]|nr:ATP-binding cassette domain-containing protein [Thermoleophilaceae bacterium]
MSKSFGGLRAVNDCSFEVPERAVTGLVGPNGAGKTTTFNLITGTLGADAGEITFRGRRVSGMSPQARVRLGIGRTFQDVRLFPQLSAIDNVAMAVPDQPGDRLVNVFARPLKVRRRERRDRDFARACLAEVGFDTAKLGVRARELSYGEQKLLSLARLLALQVDLLLLDEPASGLDEGSVAQLKSVVRALVAKGRTVLLVEHNMLLVRELCDHAVFMNEGKVLAHGSPDDLMRDERLQRVYLGAEVAEEAS